jgi:hypothetical protein
MNKKHSGIVWVGSNNKIQTYHWVDFNGTAIEQPEVSAADHSFVLATLKGISGRMLTLVEASITDKEQRKALKDIVKIMFSEEMNHVEATMFSRKYIDELCTWAEENAPEELEPVDVEDIIRG